jgi:hypothetical protein
MYAFNDEEEKNLLVLFVKSKPNQNEQFKN